MKSWHVEFDTGLTIIVEADNYYSAGVLAVDKSGLSTFNIISVSLMRGGD